MNIETIIVLVIISLVACIMILIGISQINTKDTPVGFYNVIDPPKKQEITNIPQWNKKHGRMWIAYGVCIELGFWIGYFMPGEVFQMTFLMGGILIPLPFMVINHRRLEKEYRVF